MKFLTFINEEYITSIKARNAEFFSVYRNPTPDDFKELKKEMRKNHNTAFFCRYIADNINKAFYIWDAFQGIHNDVIPYLQDHYNLAKSYFHEYIGQVAALKGNKIQAVELDEICDPKDYKWADKWIDYGWSK